MNLRARRMIQREFTRLSPAYTRVAAARPKREVSEFVRWIHTRPDEWVLDAACGPGTLAWAMAPLAARVCGLDLCPRMIRAAREAASHSSNSLFLTVGDVEHLPFPRGFFDLTTCTYAFANLANPLRVVKELARVTSPGGRVAIADVVAPEDPACCAYFNQWEALRSSVYTRILKRSAFLELFGRAGLYVEKWERHRRRRSFREWLSLSPAASNPQRANRLRQMLLNSAKEDGVGLNPRRARGDIIFYHTTAWFLLFHF
jgi:ubiquinone/menaquinone biosynthesis C-methylase UbiE